MKCWSVNIFLHKFKRGNRPGRQHGNKLSEGAELEWIGATLAGF